MEGVNFLFLFLLFLVTIVGRFSSSVQTSDMTSGIDCIESEKNALIKFKRGFKKPSQSMLSWILEESCCNWKGVECDNTTGHVITLDLHKQNLQGEFGTSLFGLPHLRHLDLSQNNFLGAQIPEFISTFKNLEYLNLSKTHFRGTIPEHLGNLSQLQFLDLSGGSTLRVNNLQWVQHLFSMKILDLSGVDISSAENWLREINLLTYLTELRLSACQLATLPKLPPVFLNFTFLRVLDLSLNRFNAPIPSWLFNTSHSLVYLNLTRSQLHGLLPNAFEKMTSLRVLDLSQNSLEGNLPPTLPSKLKYLNLYNNKLEGPLARSIAQLRELVVLDVASNSFDETITENFLNFSDLRVLDLSSNSIILNLSTTWIPRFQLDFIGLKSCRLGTQFPRWLQTQNEFSFIDISRANISGKVPDWFWNLSANVQHIDLSQNYFRGEVPEFTERGNLKRLDLRLNSFHGPLPHFSPQMMALILAGNSFNGSIAPVCESLVMNNSLGWLDLSLNDLSGQLPDCWKYGKNLVVLNLARNNLSGVIPHSFGYLDNLKYLQLQYNRFSKTLPLSLNNITTLEILDVSENSLSGIIPTWLGESSKNLKILRLSINKFKGNIPRQICQLRYLFLLDLSSNALSGTIPRCVENLHTMSGVEESPPFFYGPYADYRADATASHSPLVVIDLAENHLSGEVPAEITSLTALSILSLSRNSFTGAIPRDIGNLQVLEYLYLAENDLSGELPAEITSLTALSRLYLSMNNFTGAIPQDIGNMQVLKFLDLSRNKLSCSIPPSIAELKFLQVANFSFNGLRGKIPEGNQFVTFSNDSYLGNPDLCGIPLSKDCSDDLLEDIAHCNKQQVQAIQHEENNWLDESAMYVSMGIGFFTTFWAFWATLALKKSWRYAYMRYLDKMGNKIYVFAAIRLKKFRKQQRD